MPYGVMVSTGGSNPFSLRSNRSGATNLKTMKDTFKNIITKWIKEQITQLLVNLELLDKSISAAGLQNEQFVLDFYDKLNEISVRK